MYRLHGEVSFKKAEKRGKEKGGERMKTDKVKPLGWTSRFIIAGFVVFIIGAIGFTLAYIGAV